MKSWADALGKAIEHATKTEPSDDDDVCPLCVRSPASGCAACPVSVRRAEALLSEWIWCGEWNDLIEIGNRKALRRARQLEAYIRKHPRKWMHMEPDALAREVKKEKV